MIKKIIFLGGEDVSARIDISKRLISLGCEIEIIGSENEQEFKKNKIKYKKIKLNREFNILDDIETIFKLRNILTNYKEEVIVHAFDTKLTMFLPIASFGLKNIKVVRTINGMGRIFTEKKIKNICLIFIYKLIQKLVKRRVNFTIFQNTDNFNYFIKAKLVASSKAIVIKSSGINLDKYSLKIEDSIKEGLRKKYIKNKDNLTFILVSRLIKQKGIYNFIEAAKLSFIKGYNFNFLLVGQLDSNKDAISIEYINKHKKFVNYLGKKSNVKELLSISDIFVLPTYYSEGVPRVLLEASAMSLALLTTNMPGCNDVLIDGFNGYTININDTQDLLHKMNLISHDLDMLNKMKKNSLKHVENFNLEKVTLDSYKVYAKVS